MIGQNHCAGEGAGMISKRALGMESQLLNFFPFWGSELPKFLHQPCFSKRIDLACNVLYGIAMMNFLTI